ncbi:hypothetical protein BD324DRAFT_181550 [Kockovaella imperatae]|uniref:Short-chain dehydrogenase/reductase SDR n=1 Tax=Kockovaella imperatae TaxID=4999 RepID=A0A1Y1U7A6_9TREE|nr:hypothetical protein BD324DRAFT_181550 [Kockovaella imperatae]ORX33888.1 hypothetical protein BD324DRAFT_181550 [Kockovaella imperatae]
MRRVAVIIGAGPGTGAAIAQRFSATHSILVLSRSLPGSLPKLNLDTPSDRLLAATSDGSNESLKKAFELLSAHWPNSTIDVGVYNTNFSFSPGPFLERTEDQLRTNLESGIVSAFNFSQHIIPHFLANEPNETTRARGTLIFTGATMALRGGAPFSTMAPAMFARRALTQSLAREFGPKGVHVVHAIIDGKIAPPKDSGREMPSEAIDSNDIAQNYLDLVNQRATAWTQELDIRPSDESW